MKAGKKNSSCIEEQARGPVDSNTFVRVMGRKTFRTGHRSLLHLSQGGKKRAIQLSCAGSVHLGFDNELVARFPDGALRRQLPNSVPDRPGIRARVALIRHRNVCGLLCKRSNRADTLHIFHLLSPGRASRRSGDLGRC
jgi:hypothetical protein